MFRTNKASFNANVQKEEMGITQLSTSVLTNVGVYNLYKTLTADFSYSEKKSFYCSISKMEITYNGIEKHLYSEKNRIHIYLTKGNDKRLINYILEQFPNIEKASELLSSKKEVAKIKKQEFSKEEKINNAPFIKMVEYEEPKYDYEYCNGYPNQNFIGIIGKNGETIEIDFNAHEELFDPKSGEIRNYPVAHAFNLYTENHENLTYKHKCKNRAEPDTDVGVRPDAKTEFNRTVKRS